VDDFLVAGEITTPLGRAARRQVLALNGKAGLAALPDRRARIVLV